MWQITNALKIGELFFSMSRRQDFCRHFLEQFFRQNVDFRFPPTSGLSHSKGGSGVADRWIIHTAALIWLIVIAKLQPHVKAIGSVRTQGSDRPQEHPDGVTATNGVGILLEITGEPLVIQAFDNFHSLQIHKSMLLHWVTKKKEHPPRSLQFIRI